MKTAWDYTELATAYLKRPDYSDRALDEMLEYTGVYRQHSRICDIGAGTAHLTLQLAKRGLTDIVAVEPNDAMRKLGEERTVHYPGIRWVDGTGEDTGLDSGQFNLVTFGSSFNVTDRQEALLETGRILKPGGWFACMWNHRHLDDPVQDLIERIIRKNIPGYTYGDRREDQAPVIEQSGLFDGIKKIEGSVYHSLIIEDCVEAWQSHATLQRQAGQNFDRIISEIKKMLVRNGEDPILIPYTTTLWIAHKITW